MGLVGAKLYQQEMGAKRASLEAEKVATVGETSGMVGEASGSGGSSDLKSSCATGKKTEIGLDQ
jgi:hypothetical protein